MTPANRGLKAFFAPIAPFKQPGPPRSSGSANATFLVD
jgi:hypothetical protein